MYSGRRAPLVEGALLERWLAQFWVTGSTVLDRPVERLT